MLSSCHRSPDVYGRLRIANHMHPFISCCIDAYMRLIPYKEQQLPYSTEIVRIW